VTQRLCFAEIAFCFWCRNDAAVSFEPGCMGLEWFTFDPGSAPVLRLLSGFRAAAGTAGVGSGGRRVDNGSPQPVAADRIGGCEFEPA
jgi:hypothetical protein